MPQQVRGSDSSTQPSDMAPGMFPWPLVVTWATDNNPDHYCCRATDSDMSVSSSTCQGISMASGDSSGYSHQAVPHRPCISSSASLHRAQAILLLSLPSRHQVLGHPSGTCPMWLWAEASQVSSFHPGVLHLPSAHECPPPDQTEPI